MVLKYKPKNTNVEKVEQINIVSKYITSTFGRSDLSYLVPSKYKFPEYRNNEDIITIVLNYDKITIVESSISKSIPIVVTKYSDVLYNLLSDIPKRSFINFIFNGVLGRSSLIDIVDLFLNQKCCKGILLQPYSLCLSMGLGIQHCLIIDEYTSHYNIYIIDDYVLHDSFTVRKEGYDFPVCVCLPDDQDYVEDYQKLRLTEDIIYYGCKICDYKSKEINKINDHIKNNHFFQEVDTNLIIKYQNSHNDVIPEIMKRIRFLFFNVDRLKRMNLRIIHTNDIRFDINSLCDQLKFIYNNVILIESDESVVLRGSDLFMSLDLSKECWITDREWSTGRLRVLKDKILFNI